ncbi:MULTISPECIES: flagellar hook assembly protein FlgD [Pseudomonas]|uniref:Basal-body rod modification protein FlgD n=1 Tax=Pseudomonas neustonica TaxID=2487346 RepID=A0ABX9XJF6_9PSED|nr:MULTISPECIES: flagellar hook assembly protein FlgD [Pseudomonas]MBA6418935.1 flagellar hook assembly protein FlgD [Pseudomonas sp. 5Ae-yellow]ROZ82411.1 flagellar hook assembly protein FlgD [Pseudomonas sp. SSM44]ROZ84341.1 flagellar hook assembly protein FlgD [Pseudomonas neustonica]|tara:strand:+ start:10366 stop:11049 length:684 start_codon:yes stop_codon:yes gene_type:complete
MSVSNNVAVGNSVLDQYKFDTDREPKSDELGKDQFLELLVAQMNNQDPLSPQENGEFIAQLAQFSTVEGIENMNTSMEALLSGYQSSQALQASSLVGRTVIVPSDQAIVDTATGVEGQFALPEDSGAVSIKVLDSAGSLVNTINMGDLKAGMHDFKWDGKDGSGNVLPPGAYTFEATAAVGGTTKQLATLLPANVDSVSLGAGNNGELLLNVAGLGSISLSNVYSIK